MREAVEVRCRCTLHRLDERQAPAKLSSQSFRQRALATARHTPQDQERIPHLVVGVLLAPGANAARPFGTHAFFNGANFYMESFSRKYEKQLSKLEQFEKNVQEVKKEVESARDNKATAEQDKQDK